MDAEVRRGGPRGNRTRKPLGEILVAYGVVTAEHLEQALKGRALDGKRIGELLHAAGVASSILRVRC